MPEGIEDKTADEMTPEENQTMRDQVAAELAAEESGKEQAPVVEIAKAEDPVEDVLPDTDDDNPWEGVNPALKAQFDEMSTRAETVDAMALRVSQTEKRIGAITNELSAAKKAAAERDDGPTKEQMAAAAETAEKWESLKADFPEWAEAIQGQIDTLRKEMPQGMDKDAITSLRAEIETEMGNKFAVKLEKRLISMSHKDWEKTIVSPDYVAWLAVQGKDIIDKAENGMYAEDAIEVLDLFTEHQGTSKTAAEIAADRKARLKEAEIVPGNKATPSKSDADMSEAEYRQKAGREIFAET